MKQARAISSAALVLAASIGLASFAGAQGRGRGDEPPGQAKKGPPPQQAPVSQAEQHQRVVDQQKRATDYKQHLDQQVRTVHTQTEQLQQQKRTAQYATQQAYEAKLREQQQHIAAPHDYSHDPYVSTPHTYRYSVGGTARTTNEYGADVLRQAVNNGYQQGYNAGKADRADHWKSNYSGSIGYRDANYGYEGQYVDRTDYNYYFRQGFQRGYTDGYNNRMQYGSSSNGTLAVLGGVLAGILILKAIH